MKISRIQNQNIVNNIYKDNEKKAHTKDEKATRAVDIEISDSAKKLVSRINTAPNVDYSEKVERIRKQILDGVYKVEPEKIAEKIISAMDTQKESEINE